MIDPNDYFNPVCIESPEYEHLAGQSGFPHNITVHTESSGLKNSDKYKIAIFGVPEGRNSLSTGSMKGPDSIRRELYRLARIPGRAKIIDLGNMKQGISFADTLSGLKDIQIGRASCRERV